jgi:hypothetical protein
VIGGPVFILEKRRREVSLTMRKRIALVFSAVLMALTMSLGGAAAAFADQPESGQPGNTEGKGGGPNKPPGQTNNPNPAK